MQFRLYYNEFEIHKARKGSMVQFLFSLIGLFDISGLICVFPYIAWWPQKTAHPTSYLKKLQIRWMEGYFSPIIAHTGGFKAPEHFQPLVNLI